MTGALPSIARNASSLRRRVLSISLRSVTSASVPVSRTNAARFLLRDFARRVIPARHAVPEDAGICRAGPVSSRHLPARPAAPKTSGPAHLPGGNGVMASSNGGTPASGARPSSRNISPDQTTSPPRGSYSQLPTLAMRCASASRAALSSTIWWPARSASSISLRSVMSRTAVTRAGCQPHRTIRPRSSA